MFFWCSWCMIYVCKTWAYCFLCSVCLFFQLPSFYPCMRVLTMCSITLGYAFLFSFRFSRCAVFLSLFFLLSHFKYFFFVFFFFLSFFLLIFSVSCSSSVYSCAIILSFLLSYSSIYIFRSWHVRTGVFCPNKTITMDFNNDGNSRYNGKAHSSYSHICHVLVFSYVFWRNNIIFI